jgi:hypothetical protein
MATTRNSYKDPINSNGELKLLLGELISTQNNNEHTSISYGDMLIYIHEKSRCYYNCKTGTGVRCKENKDRLKHKLVARIEVKGGKLCVC